MKNSLRECLNNIFETYKKDPDFARGDVLQFPVRTLSICAVFNGFMWVYLYKLYFIHFADTYTQVKFNFPVTFSACLRQTEPHCLRDVRVHVNTITRFSIFTHCCVAEIPTRLLSLEDNVAACCCYLLFTNFMYIPHYTLLSYYIAPTFTFTLVRWNKYYEKLILINFQQYEF